MPLGQVITFYSYKGGTGRTMALANAGVLLARKKGSDVLLMDWDLEAPGLHRYFDEVNLAERPGTIDLLERLSTLVKDARSEQLGESETFSLLRELDLRQYVVSVGSSLDLLWAGASEEDDYARRISAIDWDDLYAKAPQLFTCLARVLSESYSYVMIDARTGVSDTSGVCTALLPEKLVTVFTPNRQSLNGAVRRARAAVSYRRQSDDLRPLVVYPLASRVELTEDALRLEWRYGEGNSQKTSTGDRDSGYQPQFEELFRDIYALPKCDLQAWFDEVQVQQAARYAYGEDVAAVDPRADTDRLSLAHSYASFTDALDKADAPWKLKVPSRESTAPGLRTEHMAMTLLDEEYKWHAYQAQVGQRRLRFARLIQALVILAGTGGALMTVVGEYAETRLLSALAAYLLVAGIAAGVVEALATMIGATAWKRHAAIAEDLQEERFRFEARTRQYEDSAAPAKLLAERVDDILGSARREWRNDRRLLTSIAPLPRRRDLPHEDET